MTDTEIANQSLAKYGEHRISRIGESSAAGKVMQTHFEQCRREVLCSARWPFAITRAVLAELAAPEWGWAHAYQLPEKFLKIVSLNDVDPEDEPEQSYEIEGRALLTDETECRLRYIYDVTDPNLMTFDFITAFVALLAARTAPSITGNPGAGTQFEALYLQTILPQAAAQNENQNRVRRVPSENDSPLLMSRYL